MEKVKFYNTLWFAWVCMFIFPLQPLAIYLFIKNKHFYKLSRYGACLLFGLTFIGIATGCSVDTSDSEKVPNEIIQEENDKTSQKDSYSGESEIHFIDTGNSDAILLISKGKAMLVDGGDNDDETLVVNYIKNQGITELEYVIATHPHADHVGGLDTVVSGLDVKTVFVANGDADTKTYRDFIEAAINKGLSPSVPLEDKKFPLGDAYFTVMNTNGGDDTNNQSLVIEYVNGEDKILLMGDAEEKVEEEILSKVSKVDVLKVGHHGSRSSTTQAFLDKVDPEYAVITCGVNNKYGHPHQETVSKLVGIEVHRTDECGDIVLISTGKGVETACKEGSLIVGTKLNESTTSGSNGSSNNTSSNTSNNIASNISNSGSTKTVYWTPNGKSYHSTKDCSALARSKNIYSGTIAESGKSDPCDRCH